MKMRNELCSSLVFSQITLRDSWCIFYTMVVVVAQLLKNSKKKWEMVIKYGRCERASSVPCSVGVSSLLFFCDVAQALFQVQ